jgi:hypothetical protein
VAVSPLAAAGAVLPAGAGCGCADGALAPVVQAAQESIRGRRNFRMGQIIARAVQLVKNDSLENMQVTRPQARPRFFAARRGEKRSRGGFATLPAKPSYCRRAISANHYLTASNCIENAPKSSISSRQQQKKFRQEHLLSTMGPVKDQLASLS